MPDTNTLPAAAARLRLLKCAVCQRTQECAPADLAGYARQGWPRCCDEVMALEAGPEKRLGRRRAAKPGTRAEVRRGALGLGPDLGAGVVDLSEDGACVRLKGKVEPGQEVEVGLGRPGGGKPKKGLADVRWCRPDGDAFLAGLRLRRRLTHGELMDLAR